MDPKVADFLKNEQVCALAIVLPGGESHSATMHFVYHEGAVYFSTRANTKKVAGLVSPAQASLVVGLSDHDWVTLQISGTIEKTNSAKDIILSKYPNDAKHLDDSSVYLKLTPSWMRYTDFKTSPPTIL